MQLPQPIRLSPPTPPGGKNPHRYQTLPRTLWQQYPAVLYYQPQSRRKKKNQTHKQSAFLPGTAPEELPRQSWQYLHSHGMSLEVTSPYKRMGPVTPARHHHLPQLQPSQRANPCRNSLLGIVTHAPEQQSPSWALLQTHPRGKEAQTSRSGAGSPGAGGTGGGSS